MTPTPTPSDLLALSDPWRWTHVGLVHEVTDDRYVMDEFGTATVIPFSFDLNDLQEH